MGDELLTFLSQSIPILQSLSWLHITSLVFLMFWEITIQQIWRLISGHNKGSKAYVQTSSPQKNCASDFSAVTTFSALGSWCQVHLMIPCCDRTTNSPKIWHTKLRDQEFRSRVTQPFFGGCKTIQVKYRFDFPRPFCAIPFRSFGSTLALASCVANSPPTHPNQRRFLPCQMSGNKSQTRNNGIKDWLLPIGRILTSTRG